MLETSIMSYPDRGPWGSAKWRGNASGQVDATYVAVILQQASCSRDRSSGGAPKHTERLAVAHNPYLRPVTMTKQVCRTGIFV